MIEEKELLEAPLSDHDLFSRALFERPKKLSSFLPYLEEIEGQKVILLKDGSLGAVYKLNLIEHEPMGSDEIVKVVNSLKSLFNLPESCVLQVLFDQYLVSPYDKIWSDLENSNTQGHAVSQMLFKDKLESLRRSNKVFRRETFICVRFYPVKVKGRKTYSKKDTLILRELKEFLRSLREFNLILKDFEASLKVDVTRMDSQEIVTILRRHLNPKLFYKRCFTKVNPNHSLSDQVLYNSPVLDFDSMTREGVKTATISLKSAPAFRYQGGMASFLELDFPFRLSLNFSFPSKNKVKSYFDTKEWLLEKAMNERGKRQLLEVKEIQKSLAYDDRILHMTFNATVEGENEETLEDRVRAMTNVFTEDLEAETIVEKDIGLGLYLASLPLNYTPLIDFPAARYIRVLKSDAVCFLPIFDSFRGLEKPNSLFISREGNLVKGSLEEDPISNHVVVLADTGSGKSALIIDLLIGEKKRQSDKEPLVFVIDKKSSYEMVTPFYNGDLTIFDPRSEMPFSPFRGVFDEQKVSFLVSFLKTSINLTSPNFEIESEHVSAISKALKLAFAKKCSQKDLVYIDGELQNDGEGEDEVQINMDDFINELSALCALPEFEKMTREVEELLNKLKPFYGDGIYAKYFRGSSKKRNKSCLFYVYDLDALTDKVLQQLMTMAVIEEIRQTIKLPEHKGREGFVVIEELGMLGRDNKEASKFVIDAAETFRKLGFWLIALTPRPQNYFELEAGKAMWEVATHYLFLQMRQDSVDYIKRNSNLLDEATGEIVASLETVADKHADVFYIHKSKNKKGAFRSVRTPKSKWMSPTNAKDKHKALEALERYKETPHKALEYLSSSEGA